MEVRPVCLSVCLSARPHGSCNLCGPSRRAQPTGISPDSRAGDRKGFLGLCCRDEKKGELRVTGSSLCGEPSLSAPGASEGSDRGARSLLNKLNWGSHPAER